VSAQSAQGEESLEAQAWRRRIAHVAAREWIEHPRGHGPRKALREREDQTIRSLTSSPPDACACLTTEGMVVRADTDSRRMRSSVEIRSE